MKNKNVILGVSLFLIILIGIGIYFFWNQNKDTNNKENKTNDNSHYVANRTYTNTSVTNITNEIITNQTNTQTETNNITEIPQNPSKTTIPIEEEISHFATKIYTKESPRQNNIQITCSTLNDTIVENDATFSFCNTVGQATTAKGYQEADIFDHNGEKKKGLGGGNCQVSTTLYNAVLAVPDLIIIERHEHSNKVPYIQNGKDAAVAYGSYDLKFKNNTGSKIKITAEASADAVNIRILKIT